MKFKIARRATGPSHIFDCSNWENEKPYLYVRETIDNSALIKSFIDVMERVLLILRCHPHVITLCNTTWFQVTVYFSYMIQLTDSKYLGQLKLLIKQALYYYESDVKDWIEVRGQILHTTLLLTSPSGTGPYVLESVELFLLSPSSQMCPRGTTSWLKKLVLTLSPGVPTIRLQMNMLGSEGDRRITISPLCSFDKVTLMCSEMRISSWKIVGCIDGPEH